MLQLFHFTPRRSVGKLMLNRSRFFPVFFLVLALTIPASLSNSAAAQSLKNFDGAISVFGQFSGNTSGNGIQDHPTESAGVVVQARQTFHYWLGYEVNYGYTRFAEKYTTPTYGVQVQNNLHEATAAYLVHGPTLPILGLQPFAAIGVGALVFLPTEVGGQRYAQQYRVPILYEVGVNYSLLTSHLGLRLQYRGLSYKVPDFNSPLLTQNVRRQTGEPTVGAYFRF